MNHSPDEVNLRAKAFNNAERRRMNRGAITTKKIREGFSPYRNPRARKAEFEGNGSLTTQGSKSLNSDPLPGRLGPLRLGIPLVTENKHQMLQFVSRNSPNNGLVLEISNINTNATPQDVEAVLSNFGEIRDFVVLTDKMNKFKGAVRVTFKNDDDGLNVIKQMNGQVADGRILSVKMVQGITIAGAASSGSKQPFSFSSNQIESEKGSPRVNFVRVSNNRFKNRFSKRINMNNSIERAFVPSVNSVNRKNNDKIYDSNYEGVWAKP